MSSEQRRGGCSAVLLTVSVLAGGLALMPEAARMASSSSIACRRDDGGVLCELSREYLGSISTTDRMRVSSVHIQTKRYYLRGFRQASFVVVDSGRVIASKDSRALDAGLRGLLEGRTSTFSFSPLTTPSYGLSLLVFALGALMTGVGALASWILWREASKPRTLDERRRARRLFG